MDEKSIRGRGIMQYQGVKCCPGGMAEILLCGIIAVVETNRAINDRISKPSGAIMSTNIQNTIEGAGRRNVRKLT